MASRNFHPLTAVIWEHQENAIALPRQRSVTKLATILDSDPSLDGTAVARVVERDLGIVIPRTVRLVERANTLLKVRPAVDLGPIRDRVRHHKFVHVDAMQQLVSGMKHLPQVLDDAWFDQVRGIIKEWDAASLFHIPTHPAFMGYYDDTVAHSRRRNLLEEVDDAFDLILPIAKKLTTKLHQIGSSTENYVPAVFEALVLGRFAGASVLRDYEPALPSGGRGEARVVLGGNPVLIEARSKMDQDRGGGGAFDPRDMGDKLFRKMQKKYVRQYADIAEPLVIFFSLEAGVIQDIEPEAAIKRITADAKASTLSAIIFSDTYRGRKMWMWRNVHAAHKLNRAAVGDLRSIFPIRQFRATGLV